MLCTKEKRRGKLELDNHRVVLLTQMIKHNVLTTEEIHDARCEITAIERSHLDEEWNSKINQERQIAVSKGISGRRRALITLILEKYLPKQDLADLERFAYFCIEDDLDVNGLGLNIKLKIKQ